MEQGSGGSEFHQHGCNRGCGEFRICLSMQLYSKIVISKLTSMQKFKCVFYLLTGRIVSQCQALDGVNEILSNLSTCGF